MRLDRSSSLNTASFKETQGIFCRARETAQYVEVFAVIPETGISSSWGPTHGWREQKPTATFGNPQAHHNMYVSTYMHTNK